MLSWIIYINNQYKIHKKLKEQNSSYLKRMDWRYNNRRYINTKFMYGWHLIEAKREGMFILELERFINKEYLRGRP